MNGRCETDPLDRAVDVCDSCYGEFCKACLVLPKGRRHPICTHCTLVLSGVRGHATVQTRGDKRTVKQRRSDLQAAAAQPTDEKVFRFFDADAEPAAPGGGQGGQKGGRRAARRDRRGRSGGTGEPGRGPKPGTAPLPMPPEVAAAAAALKAKAGGDGAAAETGPGQGSATDPTELVTVTRAVARLEELRRQGTPPASSPVPPVPGTSAADEPAPTEVEPVGPVDDADNRAEEEPPDAPPARKAGPPPKPAAAAAPAPRPDRRRADGADREGRPPTAPMVGEVRTIGGRRSSDQAPPPKPARPRTAAAASAAPPEPPPAEALDDDELVNVGEALSGVERFDARQPAQAATGSGGRPGKADTDSRGNWIPPILRGMAPDAREAKTNLPQRKRGS